MLTQSSLWKQACSIGGTILLTGAIALIVAACSNPANSPGDVAANDAASSTAAEGTEDTATTEVLTFVSVPAASAKAQEKTQQAMVDYLAEQLGRKVQLKIVKDYEATIEMLATGEAQMGILGPFSYVKAKQRNPQIEPVAASIYEATQRPWYTSVIVAQSESGIQTLDDLKGKRFGFVDPSSTSGFLVPSYAFKQAGLVPETDFAEVVYIGTHDQSLIDLAAGKVDAVSVEKSATDRAEGEGVLQEGDYVTIWESDPIPESPFVINGDFPSELVDTLKSALINSEGLTNDSGVSASGYTSVTDSDYELIRQVYAEVGQPPQ